MDNAYNIERVEAQSGKDSPGLGLHLFKNKTGEKGKKRSPVLIWTRYPFLSEKGR